MGRTKTLLTTLAIVALSVGLSAGCSCDDKKQAQTTTTKTVTATSNIMDAEAFDLQTVTTMVKDGLSKDLKELEAKINDPATGINAVDLDKDGNTDYVGARERDDKSGIDFYAFPSGEGDNAEPTVIASINIEVNRQTQEVQVSGGYPEYVYGHRQNHYYHRTHGLTFGETMFLAWWLRPHPVYWNPYGYRAYYGSYGYRPVMTHSQRTTTRTSYRTTNKMSPIKKTAKPKSYKSSAAAKKYSKKAKSKYGSKYRKAKQSNSLKGKTKGMRKYGKRDINKAKGNGNSFKNGSRRAPTKPKSYKPGGSNMKPNRYKSPGGKKYTPLKRSNPSSNNRRYNSPSRPKPSNSNRSRGSSYGGSKRKSGSSWGGSRRSGGSRRRR